jgi:hypothetical protein
LRKAVTRPTQKETEISDAETVRTKAAFSCFLSRMETHARLRKAATPRHFRRQPGKSPFGWTRWWAREDSNLQPDRYERPALTIELRAPGQHRRSASAGAPLLATLAAYPQIDAGLDQATGPRRVLRNGAGAIQLHASEARRDALPTHCLVMWF